MGVCVCQCIVDAMIEHFDHACDAPPFFIIHICVCMGVCVCQCIVDAMIEHFDLACDAPPFFIIHICVSLVTSAYPRTMDQLCDGTVLWIVKRGT